MELFDVIEVEIAAPHRIRLMDEGQTKENAEAVVKLAVMRRGVEHHFFRTCRAGEYRNGDVLRTTPAGAPQ